MDQVTEKTQGLVGYVHKHVLRLNFYRAHLLYFFITILVSSAIYWGSDTSAVRVGYTDALFMATSAMTNTGLGTIDMSAMNAYQQSILFVLMALGDLSIASISIVFLRRYFFGRKIHKLLQRSEAVRRLAADIEAQRKRRDTNEPRSGNQSSESAARVSKAGDTKVELASSRSLPGKTDLRSIKRIPHRREKTHYGGYGALPAPWETAIFRKLTSFSIRRFGTQEAPDHRYLTFSPELDERGRFHNLNSEQLEELGGIEYRALGVLTWLLPLYIIFWLLLSWIILLPWSTRASVASMVRNSQPGNTNPQWWAFFVGLSCYTNTGLDLLDQSMIPFRQDYLVLIVSGAMILAGNTFYPILLRLSIWSLSKVVPQKSELRRSLAFLLQHPRRCFLFLFPSKSTWYLFGIQLSIFLLIWLAFIVLNLDFPPVDQELGTVGQRVIDGLYQIHGLRSSGFYIINQSLLSPACQIFFMINMYISAIPFILSLRSTNVYDERSICIGRDEDRDPTEENPDKAIRRKAEGSNLQKHLQNQLAYDLWWMILAVWLVTIIERDQLAGPEPEYNLFSIIFEVVSAYGTVGLSLGLPDRNTSFCSAWRPLSKLILITVMLRGRHRVLPLAVDRAVLIPGQKLMERLDDEDVLRRGEDRETVLRRYEEEIRKERASEPLEGKGDRGSKLAESSSGRREEDAYGSGSSHTSYTFEMKTEQQKGIGTVNAVV